ncbi:MAG TPA: DUF4384 domain-containing protein [Gemmatimonadales bacterium]|nr:DUF4384 domain-containing protein [Gemmatimonadales bacterium]
MLTTLGLLSLISVTGTPAVVAGPPAADGYRPRVEVWTDRGDDPYHSGDGARVHFRADRDAYITILRVDTDGRVRVLFPREPWEDNFARGGREYEVQGRSDQDAFYIDDYPGVGYVFGIAAADPFVYDRLESDERWDYRTIADGRVRGDPYVALTDLAQRIVPNGYEDWDYDIVPYYVQQHYEYPRFLCYDCHSYVSYPYWSPYDYTCVRFRMVVYDDPYYYPYRYYGGTRVVFTRPERPEPRFIFRERQGSEAFITRVRERPVNDDRRRDVGVRGRDLGGVGAIPPPRQRPITGDQGDDRDRGRGRQRPDRPERRDQPGTSNRQDRRERPDRPDRPDQAARPQEPERRAPPDERPRAEPRRQEEPPRNEPRAEPRRQEAPPRNEPRAEPRRAAPKDKPRGEPELKRRKP